MYIDALHLMSDSQALTATAASTNVIDLANDSNIGIGEPMAVVVTVEVAADNTTGDETYSVALQTDDNGSFSSASTLLTRSIAAGAAAGSKIVIPVPADTGAERYLRLNYTLGGTTPSVTVSAFLIPQNMVQNYVAYADGFTIS